MDIREMRKIAIVGCPASGKTTLANKLGALLDMPVFHLDKIFWVQEGGIKQDAFLEQQQEIMKGDSWIIDGHFWRSKTFDSRLENADMIIFFDFPKYLIYWRLFKRTLKYYGKTRPDMPENVKMKDLLDWKMVEYIWNHSTDEILPKVMKYKDTKRVILLKNPKQERAFLKEIRRGIE